MVSKQTATGYQSAVGIRAEILREANEFCQKQGLVMLVVSLNSKDGVPGRSYATAELVFKALRPDDPAYSAGKSAKPLVLASGVITSGNIDNYKVLAVPAFAETKNTTVSGAIVADITSTLLLQAKRFTIIERIRLDQLFEEQKTQLKSSDERGFVASVGKLTGARAVVLGNVNQWETRTENNRTLSTVSLSLRLVDVDTGAILFAGQGTFAQPLLARPEQLAHGILYHILGKLMVQAGIYTSGRVGFRFQIMDRSGTPRTIITAIEPGLPVETSGLKVGDIILSCNGRFLEKQDDKCPVEAGQEASLEVLRGEERLTIRTTAVDRY